jgi:mannose-6-phosphate isomerase-like protein (cupin superfamily)
MTHPIDEVLASHRPWGHFEQFVHNQTVTVKIITVNPGHRRHRLSLQKHAERDEMWQVLDSPIEVEVDGRSWVAQPGDRVWVPSGAIHRMANGGRVAGRLLEIAFGRFDEADIERLEDDYAR